MERQAVSRIGGNFCVSLLSLCFLLLLCSGCGDSDSTGPLTAVISVEIGDHGAVIVDNSGEKRRSGFSKEAAEGDYVLLTFIPDAGYEVSVVTVDG